MVEQGMVKTITRKRNTAGSSIAGEMVLDSKTVQKLEAAADAAEQARIATQASVAAGDQHMNTMVIKEAPDENAKTSEQDEEKKSAAKEES